MKRMLAGLGILVILASLIMGGVTLAQGQDPYGGGELTATTYAPTAKDYLSRTQKDGSFQGPFTVTIYPTIKGNVAVYEVDYVTLLNGGILIVPLKNNKFLYATNWTLHTK